MRRIAGPGHVDNAFVDYDELTNPNGTVYTADYGNDVQDELIGIQEAMGLGEAPGQEHSVEAAIAGMVIRYGHKVGDVIARAGNVVPPSPFDKSDASAFHPRLCLTDFAGSKIVNDANWPDLVPWLRYQRVVYLEGQAGEVASFAGSVSGATFTLAGTPVNNDLIAALAEDQLAFDSFTDWRSVDIGGVTYEITAVDPLTPSITVAGTPATDATEVTIYPHRVAGSTATARVHSWRGRLPVGAGTEETISGLMRRDRFQGHHTRLEAGSYGSGAPDYRVKTVADTTPGGAIGLLRDSNGSDGANTVRATDPFSDGVNGDPRTGLDTHGPDVGTHLYLHAGRYTV